ncbi:MAG: Asparagine synthase [candidate division BRC1 bacterium ADurb.BinA364]|nr:MAG: Asparagine synthase [candidate division BRC1 bacterium ADurb.BinA364]
MAGWLRREGKLPGAPPLHAFSDAYSSLVQCDERHISDEIVRQYSLPFSAIFIDESHSIWDPARHEPDQDAPIVSAFDPSLKLAFALAQTEGIQRMLTGHRGDLLIGSMIFDCLDPLFHGEWRFAAAELERLRLWYGISRTKAFQRHILAPLVQTLWPPYRLPGLRRRMSALYRRKANDFAYLPWIQPDFARRIGIERIIEQDRVPARLQPPSRAQRYKLIFIPHHMGMAAAIERLAARCGVELADVWADRRLARFCLAVPQNVINREAENKWLLRRAMKNVMPENARTAALKISPEPLFKKQLVDSKDYILNSLILNGICAQHGYVAANILAEAFLDYCEDRSHDQMFSYALMLEIWLRRFWR